MITQVPRTQNLGLALRAKLFRGLADPSRLALLQALRCGEHTVGELVATTGLSQSNASGHLACLRECGLVASRQEWRHVYYRLAGPAVEHLLTDADRVLSAIADRLAACERPEMGGGGEC
jgi:DNA-binding transcriptional ArsR family regulator